MIEFTLGIGLRVYDVINERWGFVALINGEEKMCRITEKNRDAVVLLTDFDDTDKWGSEWETTAEDCYVPCLGSTFKGKEVCYEHRADEILGKYPYYSPYYSEGVYEFELD